MKVIFSFIFRAIIILYQKAFSPLLQPRCRYIPTCSQYGLEAIGSDNYEQDVEVILIAYRIYEMLGIPDLELNINSIGSQNCREKYIESLIKYLLFLLPLGLFISGNFST